MRLGRIEIDNQLHTIVQHDDCWYELDKLFPKNAQDTCLESIALGKSELTHATITEALVNRDESERKGIVIPGPDRFAMTHAPRQIICVGRNYAAHAKELGNELPTSPILFNKLPSTCTADGEAIEFPESLGRVDYEGEIGVVIGKDTWQVSKDDAYDAIFGYTLLNDVTARDKQSQAKSKGHPWLMAKNHRTFCPFGPTITLKESLPWPLNLDIELKVDGQTRQSGNTRQFLFDIPTLIAFISAQIPLWAGDIIATGTPEGVARLDDGQIVEISAQGLGTLRSTVHVTRQ